MLEALMFIIGGGALAFVLYRFVRDQVRWYHANRPNRRVRFSRVAGPRRDEPVRDSRDWQRMFNESIRP
jgi:hypothetical protein